MTALLPSGRIDSSNGSVRAVNLLHKEILATIYNLVDLFNYFVYFFIRKQNTCHLSNLKQNLEIICEQI